MCRLDRNVSFAKTVISVRRFFQHFYLKYLCTTDIKSNSNSFTTISNCIYLKFKVTSDNKTEIFSFVTIHSIQRTLFRKTQIFSEKFLIYLTCFKILFSKKYFWTTTFFLWGVSWKWRYLKVRRCFCSSAHLHCTDQGYMT